MNISDVEFVNYVNNLTYVDILDVFSKKWFQNHENIIYVNVYLHSNSDVIDNIQDEKVIFIANKFDLLLKELITIYFIRFLNFDERLRNKRESLSLNCGEELKSAECIKKDASIDADECNNFRISSYISVRK